MLHIYINIIGFFTCKDIDISLSTKNLVSLFLSHTLTKKKKKSCRVIFFFCLDSFESVRNFVWVTIFISPNTSQSHFCHWKRSLHICIQLGFPNIFLKKTHTYISLRADICISILCTIFFCLPYEASWSTLMAKLDQGAVPSSRLSYYIYMKKLLRIIKA